MEISFPEDVFRPLWQATHRSEVRNVAPRGVLSPLAFSVSVLPRTTTGTAATASPRRIALSIVLSKAPVMVLSKAAFMVLSRAAFIANLPKTFRPRGPKADKRQSAAFGRFYS